MASSPRSGDGRDPTGIPAGAQAGGITDSQRGRANETGLNTDVRGGPGSAARAGREDRTASPGEGLFDEESTEPRADTRIGHPSSQGLTGAQGSGGGAERGINQPPQRARPSDDRAGGASRRADDSGVDPAPGEP